MAQVVTTPAASQTPSVKIETKPEELSLAEVKTGPAAATFIAGGIGAAALGLIIPLSEAIPAFKTFLTWDAGVGPLSGKVIIPMVLFLVIWLVLGLRFRDKNVNLRASLTVGFIGLAIGLLGTFPPIYDLFTAK